MALFLVHGECKISVEGSLLVIDVVGPWNLEFFDHLHQELATAAKQLTTKDYSVLLIPRGEAIAVNQAKELHVEFIKRRRPKAVAIVLKYCSSASITQDMCTRIYKLAGIEHEFFEDELQARTWLQKYTPAN